MKVKPPEMARALARPDGAIRFYLLTGPDAAASIAGARALGEAIKAQSSEAPERVDIHSPTLKSDPARLADEAASIALFGGPRYVELSIAGAGDDCVAAVTALLEAPQAGNPVVAIGPAVSARSKLMKLAEGSRLAMATIHYPPEGRELEKVARDIAGPLGLRFEGDVGRLLVDMVAGDRLVLAQELEKLALYLDASPAEPKTLTPDALIALGAETHEEDIARSIDVALGGRVAELRAMIESIDATGLNEIRLIRAMGNRARLLARLRAAVDGGRSPGEVARDRSVFFKEQASVARQLAIWDTEATARIVERLQATERAIKARASPGGVLMRHLLVAMTHEANRRAGRGGQSRA